MGRRLLIASAIGSGGPGAARPAQAPAAAATAGTGVITGIIGGADTGRPLRRVRVTLTNSVTNANLGTAVTDAEGRFSFTRLPAGSLTLRAVRAGYLDIVFGQKKLGSGRPGTPIHLAEGQKIENVALQMPRGGVISGMVGAGRLARSGFPRAGRRRRRSRHGRTRRAEGAGSAHWRRHAQPLTL